MEALVDLSGGEPVPKAGSHREALHHAIEAQARGGLGGYAEGIGSFVLISM